MDLDGELPINAAHRFERKAKKLKNQRRYEDARQAYLKAAEAMDDALISLNADISNADVPKMLEWQRDYFSDRAKTMNILFEEQKIVANSVKNSVKLMHHNLFKEDTNDYENTSRTEQMLNEYLDSETKYVDDLKKEKKILKLQVKGTINRLKILRLKNQKLRKENETLTKDSKTMDILIKEQNIFANSVKNSVESMPQNLFKEDTNDFEDTCSQNVSNEDTNDFEVLSVSEFTNRTEEVPTERLDLLITALKQKDEVRMVAKVNEIKYVDDLKQENKILKSQLESLIKESNDLVLKNIKLRNGNEKLTKNSAGFCALNATEPT